MIRNFNLSQSKMKGLLLTHFWLSIKLASIIILSFKISYSFEIEKVLANQNLKLSIRINFALDMALKKYDGKKLWLIYSIDNHCSMRPLEQHSIVVHDDNTLEQIILGYNPNLEKENLIDSANHFQSDINFSMPSEYQTGKKTKNIGRPQSNKIAVILDYSLESGNPCLYQIYQQRMDQSFTKEIRPIFWLGEGTAIFSINWLKDQFYKTKSTKLKQQIIGAIGAHQSSKEVIDFQKQIICGKYSQSLKNEAIFWLGKHNSIESIKFLAFLAIKQKNIQLRKKAIFALSQIDNKRAHLIVIALALKEKNHEVRHDAIFWLSQIADEDAIEVLSIILMTEKDSEVKKYIIFAISQLPEDKATPILTRVAQNNPDHETRKKAKFWLDRTRNQRMNDFLNDLIQEENRSGSSQN